MKTILSLFFLFFFLSCNSSGPANNPEERISPITLDMMTEEFIEHVNTYRKDKGLSELIFDFSLSEIALTHSQAMASSQVDFGHAGFPTRCLLARQALGGGNLCLENVARGQRDSREVFNAWINSRGHRENIESVRATHMGLGYIKDKNNVYYWTQLFLER